MTPKATERAARRRLTEWVGAYITQHGTGAGRDAEWRALDRRLRDYRLAVRTTVIRETAKTRGSRRFAGRWRPVVVAGGPAKREKR